ncbi:pseudouridylate synthase PUS7L-like [Tiliqua scincoides]|uniref:pseudouridylate synthase PUS7L-like n=1 Tax=Tiliqua scincoides TaxID=71010 RepID=UPI0034622E79
MVLVGTQDLLKELLKHQSNDCSASLEKRVSEAIENIKRNGFINYCGPQRFGQGQSVQTDQIGLALLNKELVKAVQLFFTPEDADDPVNKAKKYFLQTEDPKGTLAMLPDYKVREKMLLRALNRYGINQEGYTRGWLSIPHSMCIFYIRAYYSKIWNEAAAYRIKIYGTRVVSGDLIFCEKSADSSLMTDKAKGGAAKVGSISTSTSNFADKQICPNMLNLHNSEEEKKQSPFALARPVGFNHFCTCHAQMSPATETSWSLDVLGNVPGLLQMDEDKS